MHQNPPFSGKNFFWGVAQPPPQTPLPRPFAPIMKFWIRHCWLPLLQEIDTVLNF